MLFSSLPTSSIPTRVLLGFGHLLKVRQNPRLSSQLPLSSRQLGHNLIRFPCGGCVVVVKSDAGDTLWRCANDQANSRMCSFLGVVDGQWLLAGSSFPRGRVRHESGKRSVRDGRKSTVCK